MVKKQKSGELFCITEEEVYNVAESMNIAKEKITSKVMHHVREALEDGLSDWPILVKDALTDVLEEKKEK